MSESDESAEAGARIGFIGKKLGRFSITAELGRGGMATVYRARDGQLGRDVAIKVMHGFFAGRADLEARFRREANAVAAIRHPSILAVFDFAPPAGEEPGYIVTELIAGPGLRALADGRGGRLLPEVAALVAIRVAEALGAAHAAGIVHRDVKPDNVLIDRAGGGARVVLTDFGVAHVSGMDTMTATGAVLGSPAYMSPEQARSEDVGATSDVFSLGVMLYQLCTGHLPFSGKDPLAVITAILRGQYLRPSELEPRVGAGLERIITRCLAPEPAARFPEAGAVAAALREVLREATGRTGRTERTEPDHAAPGGTEAARAKAAETTIDEEPALRRYLDDPEAFERDLAPRVARAATAAGERARRRGQIPRALAEAGRALAYAPTDPEAHALLERIGARRRFRTAQKILVLAASAIVAVVAVRAAGRALSSRHRDTLVVAARQPSEAGGRPAGSSSRQGGATATTTMQALAPVPIAAPPSPLPLPLPLPSHTVASNSSPSRAEGSPLAPIATPPASSHAVAVASDSRPPGAETSSAGPGTRSRRTHRAGPSRSTASPTTPSVTAAPSATTPATTTPATTTAPAPAPVERVDQRAARGASSPGSPAPSPTTSTTTSPTTSSSETKASVVLRASYGFCEPSLDDRPPSLRANYNDLPAGRHEIFCTVPQGGPKIHVATYDLRPGAKTSLVIVPGPDGRPMIGRTE